MELRQLRYLLAVAQELNFTRAAEKVFVSQSALSQQIQALEQEVGTVLVDRAKRGVRLTAAGELLCHHAERALFELAQAETAIQELEGLERGDLRLGVVQTVNDYLLPSLAAAFTACHPHIRLSIDELSPDAIEAGLERGELQIGLSFIPVTSAVIDVLPLFEESLALIVRDDHPLARQSAIRVATLDQLPLVMLSNTFCTRRLWEESARLSGAAPRIVIEMNTVSSILAVVEKTGLATIMPKRTLANHRSECLVSVELCDPVPSRQVGLLWHRASYLCRASRAFITLMQKFVGDLCPDAERHPNSTAR